MSTKSPGLLAAIAVDGRPLLQLTAFALLFSGGFAFYALAGSALFVVGLALTAPRRSG